MQKPFFKFTQAINDNGTIWYTIQISAKGPDPEPIIIKSRYSQLREIHDRCMETQFRNELPEFPQKKLFGSTKEDFIQKRKKELENYYNTLSKTMDIEKLTELNKFIESNRKKKVQTKPKPDKVDHDKIQNKFKKQAQLKAGLESIYKDVLGQIIDLSNDFYPVGEVSSEDSSKRYVSEINNAKPSQSALLADVKVVGVEENQTDFWSMFLRDEHEAEIQKGQKLIAQCNTFEKEIAALPKENIVLVK